MDWSARFVKVSGHSKLECGRLGVGQLDGSRSRVRQPWLPLMIGLLIAAGAVAPYDVEVAQFFADQRLSGDLRRLLNWCEAFAHGLGVALIALVVIILDPRRRACWPRILLTAYSAGLVASTLKVVVARSRPAAYFRELESLAHVPATFKGWFPVVTSETWQAGLDSSIQSFPSGHAATAVGFAGGLATVYPQARWLFVLLAMLAAAQRLSVGAHYPSDVLVGASIGCTAAALLWGRKPSISDVRELLQPNSPSQTAATNLD